MKEQTFSVLRDYSLRDFLVFERAAAKALEEICGGFDQAVAWLGASAVNHFFDTLSGRTMKILALGDPHRLLSTVPSGYSLLVNFGKRTYTKMGKSSGLFTFANEYLGPSHSLGVFQAAFRHIYNFEASILLTYRTPVEFKFEISWPEA